MPNKKSAERRMRSSATKRLHNQAIKSRVGTLEKKFLQSVSAKDRDASSTALRDVGSALDKAAKVGVIHANMAARKKSRLAIRFSRQFA